MLVVAALLGPPSATAQEVRQPTEPPNKYDQWEEFPPAWEKALRTLGDDTLYLLTSPLRLTPESALTVAGVGAGIAGIAFADCPSERRSRRIATTACGTRPMTSPSWATRAFSWR